MAQGNDVATSARAAGYSDAASGYRLLKRPAVAAAMRWELERMLSVEAAPEAVALLRQVVTGKLGATPAVRVNAAKAVLGVAGFVAPKAPEAPVQEDRELTDLTPTELRALINDLEGELAAKARDVTADARQIDPALADFL